MRFLLLAVLVCPALTAQSTDAEVRAVLNRQVEDWNRGDVRAFMQGYDNSDRTLFIGSRVVRGYQSVLDNYIAHYGGKEQMGKLTFSIIEVLPLGSDHALAIGNFHLQRTASGGGDSTGIFTLTLERKPAGWKIIVDHTSSTAQ